MKIEDVKETATSILNELIGLLSQQENIPQEGLQELVFNKWGKDLVEPLDESVMQSLFSKC